jgi:anti-sigma-K factor RskA
MIPIKQIDPDDLALYAMQLLPPEEMEEMQSNLQYSAEARKVLAEFTADLALLAHTVEMHEAPPAARQRLMKQVAKEKRLPPVNPLERYTQSGVNPAQLIATPPDAYAPRETSELFEMPPRKSVAARVLPWAGWALAAGLLLPAYSFYQDREQLKSTVAAQSRQIERARISAELMDTMLGTTADPLVVQAKLTSTGTPPPPQGRASYVAERGALLFVATNLQPVDQYKTYELWVLPKEEGEAPIPAGTFKPDLHGNASVMMPPLPKGVEAKGFAVTIEDDGGSKVPTAPLILQGAAS